MVDTETLQIHIPLVEHLNEQKYLQSLRVKRTRVRLVRGASGDRRREAIPTLAIASLRYPSGTPTANATFASDIVQLILSDYLSGDHF